jgi:hypothetical protein
MKKAKRYQEGGITITPQQSSSPSLPGFSGSSGSGNTYPFQSDTSASMGTGSGSGVNQTFNIQPTAQSGEPQAAAFKKGGKVSFASKRADGCAIRGKTRA